MTEWPRSVPQDMDSSYYDFTLPLLKTAGQTSFVHAKHLLRWLPAAIVAEK